MDPVEAFLVSPTEEALEALNKDQLRKVVEHLQLNISISKNTKVSSARSAIRDKLVEMQAITLSSLSDDGPNATSTPDPVTLPPIQLPSTSQFSDGLTFAQRKELLLLQHEQQSKERELDRKFQLEKAEREREFEWKAKELARQCELQDKEKARQVKLEKIRLAHELEEKKLAHEAERLRFLASSKVSSSENGEGRASGGNIAQMVKLLPKFNEADPDVFFSLFESIAEDRGWSDSDCTLLLQSVLVGKAQEAFVALPGAERKIYASVKEAVLRAYELVPEAYRQRFRQWEKGDGQAHVEVAREMRTHFQRWLAAEGVTNFDALCNLMVLEQFKNIIPDHIATYISEHKVKSPADAAVLADQYVLTHKDFSGEYGRRHNGEPHQLRYSGAGPNTPRVDSRPKGVESECRYCLERGHWKRQCPVLLSRERHGKGKPDSVRPVVLAATSSSGVTKLPSGPDEARPSAMAVSVGKPVLTSSLGLASAEAGAQSSNVVESNYAPFIRDGFVSMLGSSEKVAVRILRDTGASESFILGSVLPFSAESNTGSNVLIRGMGLQAFSAPLHKFILHSELVEGEVAMAVRPSLPLEGIAVILGNNLASGHMWCDRTSAPVVKEDPPGSSCMVAACWEDNNAPGDLVKCTPHLLSMEISVLFKMVFEFLFMYVFLNGDAWKLHVAPHCALFLWVGVCVLFTFVYSNPLAFSYALQCWGCCLVHWALSLSSCSLRFQPVHAMGSVRVDSLSGDPG